jgi:hypothetical protein
LLYQEQANEDPYVLALELRAKPCKDEKGNSTPAIRHRGDGWLGTVVSNQGMMWFFALQQRRV